MATGQVTRITEGPNVFQITQYLASKDTRYASRFNFTNRGMTRCRVTDIGEDTQGKTRLRIRGIVISARTTPTLERFQGWYDHRRKEGKVTFKTVCAACQGTLSQEGKCRKCGRKVMDPSTSRQRKLALS